MRKIKEPNDIVKILMSDMQYEKVEIAKVVLLDTKCNILKIKDVAIGGKNFVNIGMKYRIQIHVHQILKILVIATCHRIHCFIRISHSI